MACQTGRQWVIHHCAPWRIAPLLTERPLINQSQLILISSSEPLQNRLTAMFALGFGGRTQTKKKRHGIRSVKNMPSVNATWHRSTEVNFCFRTARRSFGKGCCVNVQMFDTWFTFTTTHENHFHRLILSARTTLHHHFILIDHMSNFSRPSLRETCLRVCFLVFLSSLFVVFLFVGWFFFRLFWICRRALF